MPVESDTSVSRIPELESKPGLTAFNYSTSGTDAEALDSHGVASGVSVLLWANPDNNGRVYVGSSSTQSIPLPPDGTLSLRVEDTGSIYVRTPTSGDGVGVLFEDG